MTDILGPANADSSTTTRPTDTRAGSFGSLDTWIKDCSSPTANDGTDITAAFLNAIIGALRTVARGNGNTGGGSPVVPDDNSDAMLLNSLLNLIQRGRPNYAAASGTANALTITLSPAPAELVAGMRVTVLTGVATNTAAPTLQVNGGAVTAIYGRDGQALGAGDLPPASMCEFAYDGLHWQMENARAHGFVHYGVDGSSTVNAITVSAYVPPLPDRNDGEVLVIKVANTNTGATTVDGGANILRPDGSALQAGDLVAGHLSWLAIHDGYYELLNPRAGSAPNASMYSSTSTSYPIGAMLLGGAYDTVEANKQAVVVPHAATDGYPLYFDVCTPAEYGVNVFGTPLSGTWMSLGCLDNVPGSWSSNNTSPPCLVLRVS